MSDSPKTYYKYRGKLVDIEKHFNGVIEMVTGRCLLLLLNNYRGRKYINLNKIVFDWDLTEDDKKLICNDFVYEREDKNNILSARWILNEEGK
jgi:hypothetical protein